MGPVRPAEGGLVGPPEKRGFEVRHVDGLADGLAA